MTKPQLSTDALDEWQRLAEKMAVQPDPAAMAVMPEMLLKFIHDCRLHAEHRAMRKQKRIEAVKSWGAVSENGNLLPIAGRKSPAFAPAIRVRILREADYVMLRAMAKERAPITFAGMEFYP